MPILSLFNHKGGVSKTTTTYHLGWMLANMGLKTLIVDTDPQCNLTSLIIGDDEAEGFYNGKECIDIYSCIEPLEKGMLGGVKKANPIPTKNENLYLLCGNLKLSGFENQLAFALTASEGIPAVRNMPGSLSEVLRTTKKDYDFDYILIDMSPSVGALNQCLFMSSDYFLVPTTPDFFCKQAIKSLSEVIPSWNKSINSFRKEGLAYPVPTNPPKFIGFLSQKYRPRSNAPAKSFQKWIDVIHSSVHNELVPVLQKEKMIIDTDGAECFFENNEPYNIVNISDFNSLIAQSQKHKTPVFELVDAEIEQGGKILVNMKKVRMILGRFLKSLLRRL
ncbi:AAA family ATPase (plasmid) [Pantoea dispersa]|uniref:ParA family protein n=1 Tax=Pantoea dispersa TaxID=59814 RepID=UPI001CA74DC3|nr:AAA family ATPase [Pantoea dispersa]QZY93053.1 AAA family ATPase [Pantoea dispersa]